MSLPAVYRHPAFASPSREAIAYGTGERLVLHVPMAPREVVDALSQLVQQNRTKPNDLEMGLHRAFYGFVSDSEFALHPLWSKARLLKVRGQIQPREGSTVVAVEITLHIAALVELAVIMTGVCMAAAVSASTVFVFLTLAYSGMMLMHGFVPWTGARVGIGSVRRLPLVALAVIMMGVCMGAGVSGFFVCLMAYSGTMLGFVSWTGARVGIASVRRLLLEALESGPGHHAAVESVSSPHRPAARTSPSVTLVFVKHHKLMRKGIGWADAQLLASVHLASATLWSVDQGLAKVAAALDVAFPV